MVSLRNNWNGIGRITKDLELSKTKSDIPVLNFSIAVDRPGTNKDNRITDFFDCVAWRGSAENIAKYFKKGDPIGIHGNLQTDEYEDKDGNKRKKVEICVDSFEFMPTRKAQSEQTVPEQTAQASEPIPIPSEELGDLPF